MNDLHSAITGHLATGWRSVPFWSLFRRRKVTGFPNETLLSVYRDHGVIPKSSRDDNFNKESEDLSGYQLVEEGSLVTNKMKAWQGSIAISRHRGIVSPAYYVYEPLTDQNDQFLHYLLRSEPYIALYQRISKGVRVNQWDLEHEALRSVPILLPDLPTQRAIAGFLDRETARTDRLIEKKELLVNLLSEKRSATLSSFVTGIGTGDNRLVETNSRFLPTVPDHWVVNRLKHGIVRVEQGWSPDCEARLADDGEWAVLKVGCVNYGQFRDTEHKALPSELDPRPALEVRTGDLLMSRANTPELVGSVAYVDRTRPRLMLCDKLYRIVVDKRKADAEFLHFALNDRYVRRQIESECTGASQSMQNLSQSFIREIEVAFPPLGEQVLIAQSAREIAESIGALTSSVNKSIDRLRELRAALITAAVTGQIDPATWGRRGETDRRLEAIERDLESGPKREPVREGAPA